MSKRSHSVAMPELECTPVSVLSDVRVVTGGCLKKDKQVNLTVQHVEGRIFWPINVSSSEASLLLTGQPKCYRPLKGVCIFKRVRQAIVDARSKLECEDPTNMKEDLFAGCSDSSSPSPAKKFIRGGHMNERPVLTVALPTNDADLSQGSIEVRVLNTLREVCVELTAANLEWLCRGVARELRATEAASKGGDC